MRTTCVLKEWSYEARRPFAVAGFATRVGVRGIAAAGGKIGSLARVLSASPSKGPRRSAETRKGEGRRLPDTMICGHLITFSAIGLPVLVQGGYYSKTGNVRSYVATLRKRSKTLAQGGVAAGGYSACAPGWAAAQLLFPYSLQFTRLASYGASHLLPSRSNSKAQYRAT